MKICIMCDLHLPESPTAIQYDVLNWACEDMKKNKTDAFLFAGDFTANGNIKSADCFINAIRKTGIPSVIIPGNSDLRTAETSSYFATLASPVTTVIQDTVIIAINDSDRTVTEEAFKALEQADQNAIVVMHHPAGSLRQSDAERFQRWRIRHPDNPLFYGHLHFSRDCGSDHCLQAADPDKAIGENPCITYYDTVTRSLHKSYYFCPIPDDFYDYIGISCYHPDSDIPYAREHGLKYLELRPNVVNYDSDMIVREIENWRKACGTHLSMHAPEITYQNSSAGNIKEWDRFISCAELLHPDRLTVHVPDNSVKIIRDDPNAFNEIVKFLKGYVVRLDSSCIIGIENMHMTPSEQPDDSRRFGYIPPEVKLFTEALKKSGLSNKIGINLDTGHARNNAPFSQRYTLGEWYAEIGKLTVGYHIHQVIQQNGRMQNHMPITDVYGKLISYASFFKCWEKGIINKAPVTCEIRGHGEVGAYCPTIEMFEQLKAKARFNQKSI